MDPRESLLNEPHVQPLMDLVRAIRSRGLDVPNIDPEDGGVEARALFLLETPGPRAVGTGFVSRSNPDPSARNMGEALDQAGFSRSDVVLWNVVPFCVSTIEANRNVTMAHIISAMADTQAFINSLPNLQAIVFCGRSAQRARKLLDPPPAVRVFMTFHPGAQSYNRVEYRNHIWTTFSEAYGQVARTGGPQAVVRPPPNNRLI